MYLSAWAAVISVVALSIYTYLHMHGHWHGFAIATLAVTTVTFSWLAWSKHHLETRLETAVTEVFDLNNPNIHCRSSLEEILWRPQAGWVDVNADGTIQNKATLTREICTNLRKWLKDPNQPPNPDQVTAIHVLSHEAVHLTGNLNEAETECLALQANRDTAQALGAKPDTAEQIARMYWEQMYPRMPSGYRTDACRENGPLDQTPNDNHWP